MIYKDKIYGKVNITEPVILELIKCQPLQRLKGIDQGGYLKPYYPNNKRDRFNHCVGVYLLLKKYKAPLDEQISGLIHDVSHTVFSHMTEYAMDGSSKNQKHQDNIHHSFIKQTIIPVLLKKYHFSVADILDDKNYPLLENNLPNLCADRIDYLLRDAIAFREIALENVKYFIDNLLTVDNQWVFKNSKSAQKFAYLFEKMNRKYYADKISALMHQTVGTSIKYALGKKYILKKDLYTTDKIVLEKIKSNLKDKNMKKLFDRMNGKIPYKIDPKDYEICVELKSRVVDPFLMDNGKIVRFSEFNPDWVKIIKEESKPKKYYIKFLT